MKRIKWAFFMMLLGLAAVIVIIATEEDALKGVIVALASTYLIDFVILTIKAEHTPWGRWKMRRAEKMNKESERRTLLRSRHYESEPDEAALNQLLIGFSEQIKTN